MRKAITIFPALLCAAVLMVFNPGTASEEKEIQTIPAEEYLERLTVKASDYPPCTLSRMENMPDMPGRYQLVPAGFGNIPILLDTATGQTWILYSSPPTWKPVLFDKTLLPGIEGFCTD